MHPCYHSYFYIAWEEVARPSIVLSGAKIILGVASLHSLLFAITSGKSLTDTQGQPAASDSCMHEPAGRLLQGLMELLVPEVIRSLYSPYLLSDPDAPPQASLQVGPSEVAQDSVKSRSGQP